MMKKAEKILVISYTLIAIVLAVIANVRVSVIKDTTRIAESTTEATMENTTEGGEYEVFVYTAFSVDGRIFEDLNHNQFFADPDCEEKINEPRFISRDYILGCDSKGFTVECYLAEDGRIVYCSSSAPVSLWIAR